MKKQPKLIKEILQKRPNEPDYKFQKSVSFSKLSIYSQCPRKWSFQYREKLRKFSSSIHTIFGSSLHNTIQSYLTTAYNESWAAANRLPLIDMFEQFYRGEYIKCYRDNDNKHFSSADEMNEFFEDGKEILIFIQKNYTKYFGGRGWSLVGCEIPVTLPPIDNKPNLLFTGYLDIVLYHEEMNIIKIIDLKSSTKSWSDYQKKDPNKINQLLLYKQYFSQLYNFPIDNIEIEFIILKRKLQEDSEWKQSRIQTFIPPNKKPSLNKAVNTMNSFIEECFEWNNTIKEREYPKNPSRLCEWCIYNKECENETKNL